MNFYLEQNNYGDEKQNRDDCANNDLHVEGWKVDDDGNTLLLHEDTEGCQMITLTHCVAIISVDHSTP